MKITVFFLAGLIIFCSCKNKQQNTAVPVTATDTIIETNFFPVTSYLRGQITEIKALNVNPVKYIISGSKKDSSWLKTEDLEKEIAPFLLPEIDTVNMKPFFKEEKFLDQSVNAFTFTYDPIKALPDSMQLQHWDVYVNPEDGNVKRVYMVKKTGAGKQQQLTWQADEKWYKIINVSTTNDGKVVVENELKVTWHF